jgi:hypothetical protein
MLRSAGDGTLVRASTGRRSRRRSRRSSRRRSTLQVAPQLVPQVHTAGRAAARAAGHTAARAAGPHCRSRRSSCRRSHRSSRRRSTLQVAPQLVPQVTLQVTPQVAPQLVPRLRRLPCPPRRTQVRLGTHQKRLCPPRGDRRTRSFRADFYDRSMSPLQSAACTRTGSKALHAHRPFLRAQQPLANHVRADVPPAAPLRAPNWAVVV